MDAWTAFLTWLSTIVTPDWDELIRLLPLFIILGVVGPGLSLLVLYHLYHFMKRDRYHLRLAEAAPVPVEAGGDGTPLMPVNVPYCSRHGLVYPLDATRCELDGEELSVRCPVDGTVRVAQQQLCRVCGTKYVLGASSTAITVRRVGRPPEGGAAAA